MKLIVSDVNLIAHVNSKALGEMLKVNEAVLVRIEDILHERSYFILSDINFIGKKVRLKVLVRNETIAILIKFAEDVVHLVLSIKYSVFNLAHDSAESSGFTFIFNSSKHL